MKIYILISFSVLLAGVGLMTASEGRQLVSITQQQENELIRAVQYGDAETVRGFFQTNLINANYVDSLGVCPFVMAASWGCENIVHMFIEYGADIDQTDSHGMTACMLAASYGYKVIVRTLLLQSMKVHRGNFAQKIDRDIATLRGITYHINGAALIEDVQNGMSRTVAERVLPLHLPRDLCGVVLGYVSAAEEDPQEKQETMNQAHPLVTGSRAAGQSMLKEMPREQ